MKPSKRVIASAFALCLAIGANAQWTAVSLQPAGGTLSRVHGVDGAQQVGVAAVGNTLGASLWSGNGASWISLHPPQAANSRVYGGGGGQQVGYTQGLGGTKASLWHGTAASYVNLAPVGTFDSRAWGTDGVLQVGEVKVADTGDPHASLWSGTAASWVDLHPAGATWSFAYGIDQGQQVGSCKIGGTYHAGLWSGTANSWVDLHPSGAVYSEAYGVSAGTQVGEASFHASLWRGTAASHVDLHPIGATVSLAYAASADKQVGYAKVGGFNHASLWSGSAGSWVDLHQFLPPGYSSSEARGVWTDGVRTYVAGTAYHENTGTPGIPEAFIWIPPVADFTLNLNRSNIAGQNSILGTIGLTETRPTNTLFSTYDNSPLVTTPASVTMLAGSLSRNFRITVNEVSSTVVTTIFAKIGTVTRSHQLTLIPLVPSALMFTPNPVLGGNNTSCRVVINGVAGPGGRVIAIFDNSPFSTTPSTVTVPAGATQVIFPITTLPVTSIKYVTVTARVSAGEKTGTFRINP
ncbi:MAG: hypothetical protein ABL962_01505 [Fimbriimonadaceae bacterium]